MKVNVQTEKKTANNILKQKITHVVGSFLIVRGDLGTTGTGDSDMDVAGIGDSDICFVMVVCVYCCWCLCCVGVQDKVTEDLVVFDTFTLDKKSSGNIKHIIHSLSIGVVLNALLSIVVVL